MNKIHASPYINLQGRAREAMEFYRKILGGSLEMRTMDDRGVAKPAGPGDRVTYARLEADGALLVGTDGHPAYPPTLGDNMAIALGGTDREHLAKIFYGLADGGKIKGQLTKQPWGGETGYLVDKYGINWVVSIEKS